MVSMRDRFVDVTDRLLDEQPDSAVVLADIGVSQFRAAGVLERHGDRIFNVGIREQLQVGFAAGLAKEGIRPIVHTYAPFLVERPFEQIKLDFTHQGVSGVFVSVGASYDSTTSGRTHQSPGDVALISTLPGWEVHVPGHADEAETLLAHAMGSEASSYIRLSEQSNSTSKPVTPGRMHVERQAAKGAPVVIAVGPALDNTLEAVQDMEVTVLYAATVRPFDADTLREFAGRDITLVEPYMEGTSASEVSNALIDTPHRLLSIGVPKVELRRYGTMADHIRAYGLDAEGLRKRIADFLGLPFK